MFTVTASCQIDYDYEARAYGALHLDQPLNFHAQDNDFNGAVKFPKWVNVKTKQVNGKTVAWIHVQFTGTKDNAKNETGAKRVLKFIELVGAVGFNKNSLNSYPSIYDVLEAMEKLAA